MSGLLERFDRGERQALARILTNVENQTELGREALRRLAPRSGHGYLVGLTGPPGAGKSTLAHCLIQELRRREKTVAVIAIDPSSPFSGGAALGDRIRMLESQDDAGVYLRSMASRGQVGGLALAAFGAALVLDAYGFDIILIETVGSGQDEIEIAALADTVVLVETPGFGDTVQSVKAGVLEVADIIAVNKADMPGADGVTRDLRQSVRTSGSSDWRVPVLPVIAREDTGVVELVNTVEQHRAHHERSAAYTLRRQSRAVHHARMLALHRIAGWLEEYQYDGPEECPDPVELADGMLCRITEKGSDRRNDRLSE